MGEMRNVYKILVGKSVEKRQLKRPRRKCKVNIGMDPKGVVWEGAEWTRLVPVASSYEYGKEKFGFRDRESLH
jgi:hypothetical protein